MISALTILRYRKRFIPFALLSMALFRIPLWLNKNIGFWKLMGSGRNGSFDKSPDWQQWAILTVIKSENISPSPGQSGFNRILYGPFISGWIRLFGCEVWTVLLEPIEGHGYWDGKKVFGELPAASAYEGPIAILTRATIRLSRLRNFWKNVDPVARQMAFAKGLIASLGIGEVPFIKQATFSIWESKEDMKNFAYQMKTHADVIRKTRNERWYSEDMFVRFKISGSSGTIKGYNPLTGKS